MKLEYPNPDTEISKIINYLEQIPSEVFIRRVNNLSEFTLYSQCIAELANRDSINVLKNYFVFAGESETFNRKVIVEFSRIFILSVLAIIFMARLLFPAVITYNPSITKLVLTQVFIAIFMLLVYLTSPPVKTRGILKGCCTRV